MITKSIYSFNTTPGCFLLLAEIASTFRVGVGSTAGNWPKGSFDYKIFRRLAAKKRAEHSF